MAGVELASAYVSLIPSFKGGQAAIAAELGGPATAAGAAAGAKAGSGFAKKFALGLVGVGTAIGASLFAAGNTFDELADTIVVGTGASGAALDGLVAAAKRVGTTTPSSFEDIGTAVADLNTRLGLTGKPLEALSSQFLNLSRITKTDLSTNIANITRVFGDWSIKTEDQSLALDKIFKASQSTGIGIDDLSTSVVQFGAPLRQMGFSFDQGLAIFSKWEKEGVNTQAVMSGMKIGLGKMAKAGEAPVETFKRLVASIKNAGTQGEANALALEAFGQRAGPDMAAAVREGRFELDGLVNELGGSQGAIGDADKRTRDFAESWQIFKNKVLLVIQPIASKFFDLLSDGMGWLADHAGPIFSTLGDILSGTVVPAFKSLIGFVRENQTLFATLGAAVGAMLVVFGAYKAALGAVSLVTKAYTAIQTALNVVMAANPIGLIILAIVGLVAAFVVLWNKSAAFRDFWITVWEAIKAAFHAVIDAIVAAFHATIDALVAAFRAFVQFFVDGWNGASRVFHTVIGAITGAFKSAVGGIRTAFGAVVQWIKDRWNGLLDIFRNVGSFFAGVGRAIADGIKNGVKAAINFLIGILNGLIDGINVLVDGMNAVNPFSDIPHIPHVPGVATGGIVTGTGMAMVGERGRELVTLPEGARVMNHGQTEDLLGGSGGGIRIANLEVKAFSDRFSLKQVEDELAMHGSV